MRISKGITLICDSKELSGVKKISLKVCKDIQLVFVGETALKETDTRKGDSFSEEGIYVVLEQLRLLFSLKEILAHRILINAKFMLLQ